MDAFICEFLRKYPPQIAIDRVCNRDTSIKDGNGNSFKIPKGTSAYAVHYNSKYYPNPEKFDPHSLLGEKKNEIQPNTFILFIWSRATYW